jgi:hypothetical protein
MQIADMVPEAPNSDESSAERESLVFNFERLIDIFTDHR